METMAMGLFNRDRRRAAQTRDDRNVVDELDSVSKPGLSVPDVTQS